MGVLTICCLLLLVLVVATVGFVCNRPHSTACLEPRCIQATANILKIMDLDADPCQDFYQYACGKYAEVTDIPEDKSKWSFFGNAVLHNKKLIRKLLEKDGFNYRGVHSEALYKTKTYYEACMNNSISESARAEPLLQLIESLGGWTLLDNGTAAEQWDEGSWSLEQRLIQLHEMRLFVLFTMVVGADDKNSSENILQFYQSGLGLSAPQIYESNDTKIVDAYIELGATVVTLLRLNGSPEVWEHAQMKQEARRRIEEIVEFEKTLSKLFVPKNKLRDPVAIYNRMPLQELIDMVPQLDLQAYVADTLGGDVNRSLEVVVYTPSYFHKLNQLLKDTPARVLADYTIWYTVQPFLNYLSQPFQTAVTEFSKVVRGIDTQPPMWERCMSKVDAAFGFVTGALFVEERDSEVTKKKALELIEDIREAFLQNLPLVEWMDDKTRARAEDKARAVKDKIGFPDWILDPVQLDEYYRGLNISTANKFDNMVNIMKFFHYKSLKDFGTPVDKTRWSMAPADVNAYYSASLNQMVFPSGILQAPFFNNDVPMSMNFGAIGMIMGHELTHGFDNQGRKFDKFGNLDDWWENMSASAYVERSECMEKQYSAYEEHGVNLDGHFTLGENIADNGGLKIAYMAYQNWRRDNPEDLKLQLNLTANQELFLGMAQVWCSYYTPEHAQLMVYTDPHASDRFRVMGAMSNMPEFSEAFNCPVGSPMNREDKCRVW
ncbi:endothelin-converting enzyme homolog isoform X2 [Acanthaster planci]|nr:endothelin-converting enzyme homolog isoform X2 [Acanthaster planci]